MIIGSVRGCNQVRKHLIVFGRRIASHFGYLWQSGRAVTQHSALDHAAISRLIPVTPLVTRTLDDFARLTDRIEADETGLAEHINRAFSPYHRHLFLLGMHLGTEAARIQSSGGSLSLPPRAQIRRHATLAGIPPVLWEPLAAAPRYGEQPGEVLARYRNDLTALAANLSPATHGN